MMSNRFFLLLFLWILVGQSPAWSAGPIDQKPGLLKAKTQPKSMVLVRKGENLLDVSKRCGATTDDLIKINGLLKPYKIYIGQPLLYNKRSEKPQTPLNNSLKTLEEKVQEKKAQPASKINKPAEQEQLDPVKEPEQSEAKPQAELKRTGKHFSWPVQGKIISGYGKKQLGLTNDGINIAAKFQSPVKAAEDGIVAYAGNEIRGFGNVVLIKHAEGWSSVYAHNDILLVAKGDSVQRGQEIAKSGNTGHVDAPQVHFELRHKARSVDPMKHLK
jgi:murein DD-endopeptidase MepM/ murein hydrolase activator NlpD